MQREQPPVVKAVVTRFARMCPWIDRDDLQQEAWATMLEVEQRGTWREGRAPLECYQADAVRFNLGRLARRELTIRCICGTIDDIDGIYQGPPEFEVKIDLARAAREALRVIEDDGAWAVLVEGAKPAEAAQSMGVGQMVIYRATERARHALRANKFLLAVAE